MLGNGNLTNINNKIKPSKHQDQDGKEFDLFAPTNKNKKVGGVEDNWSFVDVDKPQNKQKGPSRPSEDEEYQEYLKQKQKKLLDKKNRI